MSSTSFTSSFCLNPRIEQFRWRLPSPMCPCPITLASLMTGFLCLRTRASVFLTNSSKKHESKLTSNFNVYKSEQDINLQIHMKQCQEKLFLWFSRCDPSRNDFRKWWHLNNCHLSSQTRWASVLKVVLRQLPHKKIQWFLLVSSDRSWCLKMVGLVSNNWEQTELIRDPYIQLLIKNQQMFLLQLSRSKEYLHMSPSQSDIPALT